MTDQDNLNTKKTQFSYRLKSINILSFNFNGINLIDKKSKPPFLKYNLEIKSGSNKENKAVIIVAIITTYFNKDNEPYSKLSIEYIFDIKDPNNLIFQEEEPNIPYDLMLTFISIAISTSRGILFEKGRGTLMQQEPLPLIDPTRFIKKVESK